MNPTFVLDRTARELRNGTGHCFDPLTRTWTAATTGEAGDTVETIDAVAAVAWLQRHSQHPLRVPIAVIGPRDATSMQLGAALHVGELLADCGLVVVCDGGHGVTQAACEGMKRVGGTSIGLLPGMDPAAANSYVGVIVPTGAGDAVHALIARAAFCVIAIGDGDDVRSAVALGRPFGKLVIGLAAATPIDGVVQVADARAAVESVALAVLGMAPRA
jgi:uncharacterized protein (TIGR00725 family)